MNFAALPVGARFRFFRRGMVLTKTAKDIYTGPDGEAQMAAADVDVLPEEDPAPAARPAPPKPDDVAVVAKALDALEALHGKKAGADAKAELAAARQALRRLAAMARLKTGGG